MRQEISPNQKVDCELKYLVKVIQAKHTELTVECFTG